MERYLVDVIWNREFDWVRYGARTSFDAAKFLAYELLMSADGSRVKKVRVVYEPTDEILYQRG